MSVKLLANYRTAPDVPVLVWEIPLDEADDAQLLTQVGAAAMGKIQEPQVYELRKTAEGKAFPMGVTLGRMPNNDVVLDSRSVSRFHAYFVKLPNGEWQLVDAQSKLGTFVDGAKLERGKPFKLHAKTRVKFGAVGMIFLLPQAFTEYLASRQARR